VSRALSVAVAVFLAAGVGVFGCPPRPAKADVDYVFNVNCPISHFNEDDPIVFPDQPGISHRHAFYGNTKTNAATTTASLLSAKSTCERGFSTADRSAYWVPTLYRKLANGSLQEIHLSGDNQHLAAYYRRTGGSDGDKVKPFPKGLRMVAGDPTARSPQKTLDFSWRCNGDSRPFTSAIPQCAAGTILQAFVSFPDCWDGKHLDTADHRSHMTYARGDRGSCPSTHPVKVPHVTFEISFDMRPVAGTTFELSSGGQYSLHGDFFAAWDDRVQSALVNDCLNGGKYCENMSLSQVNLAAAGPVMSLPEPARATPNASASPSQSDHASHAASQAASASSDASGDPGTPGAAAASSVSNDSGGPGLGLGLVAALIGVFVAGWAFYYWRRRTHGNRRNTSRWRIGPGLR
jgi:hypothetical protein